jgi:hypothetical protein
MSAISRPLPVLFGPPRVPPKRTRRLRKDAWCWEAQTKAATAQGQLLAVTDHCNTPCWPDAEVLSSVGGHKAPIIATRD